MMVFYIAYAQVDLTYACYLGMLIYIHSTNILEYKIEQHFSRRHCIPKHGRLALRPNSHQH